MEGGARKAPDEIEDKVYSIMQMLWDQKQKLVLKKAAALQAALAKAAAKNEKRKKKKRTL